MCCLKFINVFLIAYIPFVYGLFAYIFFKFFFSTLENEIQLLGLIVFFHFTLCKKILVFTPRLKIHQKVLTFYQKVLTFFPQFPFFLTFF